MRIRLTQRSSRLAIRRCTFLSCQKSLRQLPAHLFFQPQAPTFRLRFFLLALLLPAFQQQCVAAAVSLSSLLIVGTFLLPC
ncbi:Uncharacterised protein [Klebsiella pneumoniae]|uniref:Uncharacterized protein n=1 Tax=Klebsiella pneumoniae TaxID=573 RepID=A0A378F6T8_KLEPN|nr:Uncharacterised protein [Klebsiella pneumoniae]